MELTEEQNVSNNTDELKTSIDSLRVSTDKANSYKRAFLQGIVYGIGFAIGTSIIAVVVIGFLVKTVNRFADVPVVGDIIRATDLITVLNNSAKQGK